MKKSADLSRILNGLVIQVLLSLWLFGAGCSSSESFVQKTGGGYSSTITLQNIHMTDNGYVGFICKNDQANNSFYAPDSLAHKIRRSSTYTISLSDMMQLLEDASAKPQEIFLANILPSETRYYTLQSFSVDSKAPVYLFADNKKRILKINEEKIMTKNLVFLIHKEAARRILDKIIK